MKVIFNILGGLLLVAGIGWAIYIIVAVATSQEGFATLTEMIPALVFHAVALFLGMVFFGLGQRVKKQTA